MMESRKFAAVMDKAEQEIKSKVSEILGIAHGMTTDGRRALAEKLEGILAKIKGEVAKSDTAVLVAEEKKAAG
jgi:hypothetical protein